MSSKQKTAKVLDTPEAALQNSSIDFTRLTTLRARAALTGLALQVTKHDFAKNTVYVFALYGITIEVADSLDAADKWLDKVTGAHHG